MRLLPNEGSKTIIHRDELLRLGVAVNAKLIGFWYSKTNPGPSGKPLAPKDSEERS